MPVEPRKQPRGPVKLWPPQSRCRKRIHPIRVGFLALELEIEACAF